MALTEKDLEQIVELIREQKGEVLHCSAAALHTGKLSYSGGRNGTYTCECGMHYEKDGRGGLRAYIPA